MDETRLIDSELLRPPPRIPLSEWADKHFALSVESSAEAGRWTCYPYQRGILDAITDPRVQRVSVMKSARVGYTKCINAAIAYHMSQDPCPILLVQPTVEDAEGYSKEEIAPMLRDVGVLAGLVRTGVKTSAQTILHKTFPGGVLSMVGANSGRGFRRVSRRVVIFDEVDGYPPSAGSEGDPIALGEKRSEFYWNRKIIAGSTPLIAGASRIEELYEAGDRRHYHLPCPHCGKMDFLVFNRRSTRGHVLRWFDNDPSTACFQCSGSGCVIEESHKRAMLDAGEWMADAPFDRHASFRIWEAYSLSPNTSWASIAAGFVEAKRLGVEKLKTFVNTVLGETWQERGEAPDWERLHQRREPYAIGSVPAGVVVLTAGVDVQKDRLVYEVVGWAPSKESWSVEIGQLYGDTAMLTGETSPWVKLSALLGRTFPGEAGAEWRISMMAVDSGYNTQVVYTWCRQYPLSLVIACKGISGARLMIGTPSPVDVTIRGKRLQRGYKVWPIGVDIAKGELYAMLGLSRGDDDPPPGYCHFPEYSEDYFKQLTAEHLVTVVNRRTGRTKMEWQVLANRENHHLDTRILARAASSLLGIDRMAPATPPASTPVPPPPAPAPPPTSISPRGSSSGFWGRPRGGQPGKGWLGRRR